MSDNTSILSNNSSELEAILAMVNALGNGSGSSGGSIILSDGTNYEFYVEDETLFIKTKESSDSGSTETESLPDAADYKF